ncbi:HNH endonuclease [Microbacterium sp. ASV49]|uniref:DUF222 domain-containing protein n=1 Tax=Microbacterium candidum TaxID=3041922 RepID=A0ABT7MVT1_9MICO|nr:HNH endonuclease signature motif containing protein [Microbacterium sp. ASV49]MDL9978541.1 DUF222 domain-containing protein [Microbacterium sp. ASV49]
MTSNPTTSLAQAVAALDAVWAGASRGGESDAQSAVTSMTDAGILAVNEALAAVRRQVDALHVRVAAGIADRSRPELGSESLARKTGHRTPARLIAATTGGHAGDAARLIQVGEATAERALFSGERAPSRHPHVQAAVASGAISVPAAAAIAAMLDKLAMRVERAVLADAEQTLVSQAALLSLDELGALLQRAQAHLDPDGLEPVIEDLHARRSLKVREDRDGMIHLNGVLDPETGAPLIAAVDALVTRSLRTNRGHNRLGEAAAGSDAVAGGASVDGAERTSGDLGKADSVDAGAPGRRGAAMDAAASVQIAPSVLDDDLLEEFGRPVAEETRTLPQLRADALAALCRHALGCDRSGSTLANTTVIVRVPLEALTTGTGVAEIDGVSQPIDAGTARRMCANAEIIPLVLGADSEILDFGKARRPFSRAQRLALEERDGGCVFCGLPGSYAEAHHVEWWSRGGPTDLTNGVLLCTACHHRIHNDGWEIRIETPPGAHATAGVVWFIPPPHIDPARTPRIGGRARFDWVQAA